MKTGFRIRMLLAFTLTSLFVAIGCDDDDNTIGEKGFSVTGVVTDSATGAPIDSARVSHSDTLLGTFWYSDSTGKYTVASLAPPLTVFVQKAGYVTKSQVVEFAGAPTEADFELVSIP